MQAVHPLSAGTTGDDVADLQFALDALGFGEEITRVERSTKRFGEGTVAAVRMLQREFGIVVARPGEVDERTAEVINQRLHDRGHLYRVEGTLRHSDGAPSAGNLVFAFDVEFVGGAMLGQAWTNADGVFGMYYDPKLYTRPSPGIDHTKDVIDLIVFAYDAGGKTIAQSEPRRDPERVERVDLTIAAQQPGDDAERVVRGQVIDAVGTVGGVEVVVFDRDIGPARKRLGRGETAPTDRDGRFEVRYSLTDLQDGEGEPPSREKAADLVFELRRDGAAIERFEVTRLFPTVDGQPAREETVSDDDHVLGIPARPVEEVRILVRDPRPEPRTSEYEQVWRAIEPMLSPYPSDAGDVELERLVCAMAARFDEEKYRDISFVSRETGLDRQWVRRFADACRLAEDPFGGALSPAVFYGLARTRGVTNFPQLATMSLDDLRTALTEAGTDAPPAIPPIGQAELQEIVQTIREVLTSRIADYRPAEDVPTLAELLRGAVPDREDQATLWRAYADHQGTPTEFWRDLRDQPGFTDPAKVAGAQFTFHLGLLTQNNVALMDAVRARHPEVADLGSLTLRLDTPDKWAAILDEAGVPIPPAVPGEGEERKANYAEMLAGAAQVIQPTAAVANVLAGLPATRLAGAQPAVARFLSGAVQRAAFDLAADRIDDLVSAHGDVLLADVAAADRPTVIDQVKRVQRLFRLSSGPESLKALLNAGFDSAHSIARLPRDVAMDRLGPDLPETQKLMAYNRAVAVDSALVNAHILLNDLVNGVHPEAVVASGELEVIRQTVAGHVPDYASLFGSVELCECRQCRSIHSAAAYLVDLLQFLADAGHNSEGLTPLDVLIGDEQKGVPGRRPDLAHIQLSCENTDTRLPYVDLVNEVLESYVVFSQTLPLKTDDGGVPLVPPVPDPNESTPGVTEAELSAGPENTRDRAYDTLAGAPYPFTLPFNQPITALRQTFEQMGTSRRDVMETFRRDQSAAAGRALDAEALEVTDEEFALLTGEHFDGTAAPRPTHHYFGFATPDQPEDTVWVAGALPQGAQQHVNGDVWAFAPFDPAPPSGVPAHASSLDAGMHQHSFDGVPTDQRLTVGDGDVLFAEVHLDPASLPEQIMLQWNDGTWEHRAYWGESRIALGVDGTDGLRYMGPVPRGGGWTRLELPARFVGLEGRRLSGMAFTLFGGRATWGASGSRTPSWVERLADVPTLLARTGVSYADLVELLRTRFVNPSLPQGEALATIERIPLSYGALATLVADDFADLDAKTSKALDDAGMTPQELRDWAREHFAPLGTLLVLDAPGSACHLELTRLRHLDGGLPDEADLHRLARFIRLWRKLGWSARDLDRAADTLQATDITPVFLQQLGQIVQLRAALDLPPQKLLSFWNVIPTMGDDALYRTLFLNKAVRKIDEDFEPVGDQYLPAAAGLKISEHVPTLLAALRISARDLDAIRAAVRPGGDQESLAGAGAPLTLATATALYRYAALARALKLPVADLITLVALTDDQPFSALVSTSGPFTGIDPARTLRFVRLVVRINRSGFGAPALAYLFTTLADAPVALAPGAEPLRRLLGELRDELIRIAADNVPNDDPVGEITRAKLSLILEAHVVQSLAELIAGTAIYTVPLAAAPSGLPQGKVRYDAVRRLLTAQGWLTEAERDDLVALSSGQDYRQAVEALFWQPRDLLRESLVSRLDWATAEEDLRTSVLETPLPNEAAPDPEVIADRFNAFQVVFLPRLRNLSSRTLVKRTMAEALGLDAATAALLLEGADGVRPLSARAIPGAPAMADFLALTGDGLAAAYFDDETLAGTPATTRVDPAVSFHWPQRHGFSVRWHGAVLATRTQRTTLHLRAGGSVRLYVDGVLLLDRHEEPDSIEHTAVVDLRAGQLHKLTLEYVNHEADAVVELRWSDASTPSEIVPQRCLYSHSRGDGLSDARTTYVRMHKAATLARGFTLTGPELAYLTDPGRADALHLDALPVDEAPLDPHALFRAWTGWIDFSMAREAAAVDPSGLLDVVRAPSAEEALNALARITGWSRQALADLAGAQGFDLPGSSLQDLGTLRRLADAMSSLRLLGAPVEDVFGWAAPAPETAAARAAAREARRALKAKYDEETWPEVARPLTDRLREKQRAALVAYLQPRLGYSEPSRLFEHFLIDVEMDPCNETSRIKQGISSVQLFIQRCRMGLEPQVAPTAIDRGRWQWMKSYRVWEANRKVFLFPENWLEPELRDDKSPFFRELESEMLQGEVTSENAEIALAHYLEKLGAVSQLRVCGYCVQSDFGPDEEPERVLHVFGCTFSTPHVLYYRRLVTVSPTHRYWTAWEQVPVDIETDEVLPVIWNRRLYLFWTTYAQTVEKDESVSLLRLGWIEYRSGKWSPMRVTPVEQAARNIPSTARMEATIRGDRLTITFSTLLTVRQHSGPQFDKDMNVVGNAAKSDARSSTHGSLTFQNFNGLVEPVSGPVTHITHRWGFTAHTDDTIGLQFWPVTRADQPIIVFSRSPGTLDLYSTGSLPLTLNDPFFVQEGPRSYVVFPKAFPAPKYEYVKPLNIVPYLAVNLDLKPYEFDQDDTRPFLNEMEMARTEVNPWLAGRAGIAALEIRTVLAALPGSLIQSPDTVMRSALDASQSLSKYTTLFDLSVIQPGMLVTEPDTRASMRFETFFHPYAPEFQRRLNRRGVPGLLTLDSQQPQTLPNVTSFSAAYAPGRAVEQPYPVHDVDFTLDGAYSLYNWEIFFHVPLFLATRLSQNQRFEEAMDWFHYVFDPTRGSPTESAPQRHWQVLPLRETTAERLDEMLKRLHAGDPATVRQWEDMQAHPFEPHRVARLRRIAYQKNVVMKYIDNLIAWGDQLFRQDTIEEINEATQLYVLAGALLGARPQNLPARGRSRPRTYAELRPGLDKLSQAMVGLENDLPFASQATPAQAQADTAGLLGIGRTFYFCIPQNEKLLGYWDTVADRLFKIRHCMNIEGVVRELPLFEPPIDPALLVRAVAQGVDLDSVLNDLSAPLPHYRFGTLLGKALEVTADLRSLGGALLSALEKRDAEGLAVLRAAHETDLLNLVQQVKRQQLEEARAAEEGLRKNREVIEARFTFYNTIADRIKEESDQLNELATARDYQHQAGLWEVRGADVARWAPDVSVGLSIAQGGGWSLGTTVGRGNLIPFFEALSREKNNKASANTYNANRSSILGGWIRRADDWKLQRDLAVKELTQIDKQIAAAGIRVAIAEQELENTGRQIEQSLEIKTFLRDKYTSEELYVWMQGETAALYFQCYQLAYDLAKKAERCYRFEQGLTSSDFVRFGSWDSTRKGLLAGERLHMQLRQLERAYLNGNRRDYELTKHVSLVRTDPQAFVRLKAQGWCEIELPEGLFDIDYPGHYMRRIKSVSLTIPAVVGPYSGVNCTLRLLRDTTRIKSTVADGYPQREGEDDRFVTNWAPQQAIATSSGHNDTGSFELNFRDERYLPFEGAGAVSRWRIELDPDANNFDIDSLPDVVLHLRYTAREGGEGLKKAARATVEAAIAEAGWPQARLVSLKHEFPTEWHRLTGAGEPGIARFALTKERFPFLFRNKVLTVGRVQTYAVLNDGSKPRTPIPVYLTPPDGEETSISMEVRPGWRGILAPVESLVTWTEIKSTSDQAEWQLRTDSGDLARNVDDLVLICEYAVTGGT
ncbi:neuraminidase-like domain-containing protein [Microbispora rosea]|uniref:Tc toxin subunit A-related protein n=1 Tax=Microbispora rosea TaxID=58117 RepID=UPI00341BC7CA